MVVEHFSRYRAAAFCAREVAVWKTHRIALGAIVLMVAAWARAAAPQQELAAQVKAVFKENCYRCHGDRGAAV